MEGVTTSPLTWPTGWKRTESHKRRRAPWAGSWTIETSRRELARQLELLGAEDCTLSTNLRLRIDGQPYSGQPAPLDPGAAVWFKLKKAPRVLACDAWQKVEHNIRAMALHVGALRGMDRWGVGSLDQVFTGYTALPERAGQSNWFSVLQFLPGTVVAVEDVELRYRTLAKERHPDRGGSADAFKELVAARDAAIAELSASKGVSNG